ncbi:MAG: hypothetical protein WA005_02860 [Candidatus Binataceae bacterium]
MQSYRIKFQRMDLQPEPLRPVVWHPFLLRVHLAGGAFQFAFRVLHAEVPTGLKIEELTRRHGQAQVQTAIIGWAIGKVEQRLYNGPLPPAGTSKFEELELGEAELPEVEQLVTQKTCAYQLSRGRELFCSAAASTDETADASSGLAPTSRPMCKACDLPDDRYRCFHLTHPRVMGIRAMTPTGRQLTGAYCEINSPNIRAPSRCHASGHDCWEYIVEPPVEPKKIGFVR